MPNLGLPDVDAELSMRLGQIVIRWPALEYLVSMLLATFLNADQGCEQRQGHRPSRQAHADCRRRRHQARRLRRKSVCVTSGFWEIGDIVARDQARRRPSKREECYATYPRVNCGRAALLHSRALISVSVS
jgi:hypothetical protein